MRPSSGLYSVPASDLAVTIRDLQSLQWSVYFLPAGVTDRRSFFEGVRDTLPLDPPVVGDEKWDALSDSLWGGFDALEQRLVAIIWPHSSLMAEHAPKDFEIARSILADLCESLESPKTTSGMPKQLMAVLA